MKFHEISILYASGLDGQICLKVQVMFRMQFLRSTEINSSLYKNKLFLLKFKLYGISSIFYEILRNFNMLCNSFLASRLFKI